MRGVILTSCGLISIFLLASGYESLYNRSLPVVHTLDSVSIKPIEGSYDMQQAFNNSKNLDDSSIFGTFGTPASLKLPGRTKKIDIVTAIHPNKGEWLARANTLHLLTPAPARKGNIGIALLYCRASFRTLNASNMPAEGSNLFMDTDHDWRYVYKITSILNVKNSEVYIPADNGANAKLVIICSDRSEQMSTVIEANLLSVQGIEKWPTKAYLYYSVT